jgi:hypothetical protein
LSVVRAAPNLPQPGTQYYWKVVAIDPVGAKTASEVWSFTTK